MSSWSEAGHFSAFFLRKEIYEVLNDSLSDVFHLTGIRIPASCEKQSQSA
jgi:hypothetical protein